jgi:DNA-binding NtrC family response regulator
MAGRCSSTRSRLSYRASFFGLFRKGSSSASGRNGPGASMFGLWLLPIATWREIVQGRFRQDLYYRLSVFPIDVPPLRERFEDIPELTAYFVGRSAERVRIRAPNIGRHQLEALRQYSWPGNIRELQNVVERAVILSRSGGPRRFDITLPAGEPAEAPRSARAETVQGYVTAGEFRERERQNVLAAVVAPAGESTVAMALRRSGSSRPRWRHE